MPKKEAQEKEKEPQNNVDPERTLVLEYHDECPVCGYTPPPDLAKPDITQAWAALPSPVPGMWFIICPACFSVHVNPNYVKNMLVYKKMQDEKRIITPNDDSRIVVPELQKVRR